MAKKPIERTAADVVEDKRIAELQAEVVAMREEISKLGEVHHRDPFEVRRMIDALVAKFCK
jgi:hypothetical protein